MTLRELKRKVRRTEGQKLPTAKSLRESMIPMVAHEDMTCGSITAYENGFAIYSSGSSETVLRIDECKSYTYRFDDGTESFCSEEVFIDSHFAALLILIGEERIEHNRTERDFKNGFIQLGEGEWIEEYADSEQDFVTKLENEEWYRNTMSCLNECQRRTLGFYINDGMTIVEIAQIEGVSYQAIFYRIQESMKKIKKFLKVA